MAKLPATWGSYPRRGQVIGDVGEVRKVGGAQPTNLLYDGLRYRYRQPNAVGDYLAGHKHSYRILVAMVGPTFRSVVYLQRRCSRPVWTGRCVEERGGYRLYECFIDGTFSKAKGGGDGVGVTKAGKGVKIMVVVDARGLPVAVDTCSASPHESQLVQHLFDFMLSSVTPDRLVGDKAYDSDALDDQMAAQGTDLIAPHRSNRKIATQDGRRLRRYRRRWTVERTIAWFQHYRRLCIRWEKSSVLFRGFLHLGCSLLLLREVLG